MSDSSPTTSPTTLPLPPWALVAAILAGPPLSGGVAGYVSSGAHPEVLEEQIRGLTVDLDRLSAKVDGLSEALRIAGADRYTASQARSDRTDTEKRLRELEDRVRELELARGRR